MFDFIDASWGYGQIGINNDTHILGHPHVRLKLDYACDSQRDLEMYSWQ
jgi:hypothetical protein